MFENQYSLWDFQVPQSAIGTTDTITNNFNYWPLKERPNKSAIGTTDTVSTILIIGYNLYKVPKARLISLPIILIMGFLEFMKIKLSPQKSKSHHIRFQRHLAI